MKYLYKPFQTCSKRSFIALTPTIPNTGIVKKSSSKIGFLETRKRKPERRRAGSGHEGHLDWTARNSATTPDPHIRSYGFVTHLHGLEGEHLNGRGLAA